MSISRKIGVGIGWIVGIVLSPVLFLIGLYVAMKEGIKWGSSGEAPDVPEFVAPRTVEDAVIEALENYQGVMRVNMDLHEAMDIFYTDLVDMVGEEDAEWVLEHIKDNGDVLDYLRMSAIVGKAKGLTEEDYSFGEN